MNKQLIIIIVYCIFLSFSGKAQPTATITSTEEQYFAEECTTGPIVCINPNDNNNTVICYNNYLPSRPCFVYHRHTGTNVSKKFLWPEVSNTYGGIYLDKQYISSSCYSTRPIFYNEKLIYDYSVEKKTLTLKYCNFSSIQWTIYSIGQIISYNINSCETHYLSE